MLVARGSRVDVIAVPPARRPNGRWGGAPTDVARVAGPAPGSPAETEIVGNSTWGRGDTGSSRKATNPARASPPVRSVVATGLAMKGAETFTLVPGGASSRAARAGRTRDRSPASCTA